MIDLEAERCNTMADDKAFVCVIRSCFKDKVPQLFKIKQDNDAIENAYTCWHDVGPRFGTEYDLQISDIANNEYNYVCHNKTVFDGDIHGNILCGGDSYYKENDEYYFTVINMTTFEILVEE